jgi:hypothetical protein
MRHSAISKEEVDFQEQCVGSFWLEYLCGPWPNRLAGAYESPLCYSVWILCPWTKLTTCPEMAGGGELQLTIKLKPRLRCMNRQLHWIMSIEFQLVGPLRYHSVDRKTIC